MLSFQQVKGEEESGEGSSEPVLLCNRASQQWSLAFPGGGERVGTDSLDSVGHRSPNLISQHQTLKGTVQRGWVGPMICNFSAECPRTTSVLWAGLFWARNKVMSKKGLLTPSHPSPRFLRTVLSSPAHSQSPGMLPNHETQNYNIFLLPCFQLLPCKTVLHTAVINKSILPALVKL